MRRRRDDTPPNLFIPECLAIACRRTPERASWLARLPDTIKKLQDSWSLSLGAPFEGSCAWVAPAVRHDGTRAVLKLAMPHMEAANELQGLRFWDGEPTVRLLKADPPLNAMLLEFCEPGSALSDVPETEQDQIIAGLLPRLWRRPPLSPAFRPLSSMIAFWTAETIAAASRWSDAALIRDGLRVLEKLARPSLEDVLLATDLHAGNVLRAQREPWLVIDPKPFVGDPAFDATQHLFNCKERLVGDPDTTIRRFAELLQVDEERVRLWMFARSAAEPRDDWNEDSHSIARILAET